MKRGRAATVAIAALVLGTASCRAIFGIDDFAGGDDTAQGDGATDGSIGAEGSTADGALADGQNPQDGAGDASLDGGGLGFTASDACAGCLLVGEVDVVQLTGAFIGLSANDICWCNGGGSIYCRSRIGGPISEYDYDSGTLGVGGGVSNVAVSDHAVAGFFGQELVGFTLGSATGTKLGFGALSATSIAALPNDQLLVLFAPDNTTDGGIGNVYSMAQPAAPLASIVGLVQSSSNAGPIPGSPAFYAGSFVTVDGGPPPGIQRCALVAGMWQCGAETVLVNSPVSLASAADGSVAISTFDEVQIGSSKIGADGGITGARKIALSRGQVFIVQSDAEGGAALASWVPGSATVATLIGSLGIVSFEGEVVGDDDAVFFVVYNGTHASIIELPR